MGTREITVTVDEDDWLPLRDAADCAGMSVSAYVAWAVRLLAMQAQPGRSARNEVPVASRAARPSIDAGDEPESAAWMATFSERLSHRAEQFRND